MRFLLVKNSPNQSKFHILIHSLFPKPWQKCQNLCSALTYATAKCNVNYFDPPFCYLGNQGGFNKTYQLSINQVVVSAKKWTLLVSQTSGAWFSLNEWSSSGVGKYAILDQIENFRLVWILPQEGNSVYYLGFHPWK
jgi:hypothetical protein